jgi:hypothetical protein
MHSSRNNLQKFSTPCLLKIVLFLQFHIDKVEAKLPMRILALSFFFAPFNQLPNILVMLDVGSILKVKYIIRQIMRVNVHEINK